MNDPTKEDFIIIIKSLIIQITKHYNFSKIYNYNFLKDYINNNITIISSKYNIHIFKINTIQNLITNNLEAKLNIPVSQTNILIELIHLLQYITENSINTILNLNIIQLTNDHFK
jgi:hypothetical protein